MPLSKVNTKYRIHRVEHTPSTAHNQYSLYSVLHNPKICCLQHPASLSALSGPCCTQFSTFPWVRVIQWIDSQRVSHLPPYLSAFRLATPKCSLNHDRSWPRRSSPNWIDHGVQAYLSVRRSWPPSEPLTLLCDRLQVHLQVTRSVLRSASRTSLDRSL